ncbi:rhamnulokinase [Gorillibacterium timonense]|uniref:rhamnulokinase n=1 Tax=Gorillibacterium timonense TaxID=1689269 RepID=UPI00071C22F5|nr:rhamnulokinase family protein [Gorillibacterium timonense]
MNKTMTMTMVAVDLGASSGRVILGTYDGQTLVTEEIHRFANEPVRLGFDLVWNVLGLFAEIKRGIKLACRKHGQPVSLSIDTWGVDYGYLDKGGRLLYPPHHYRDERMSKHRSRLEGLLPPQEQFRLTGNQPDSINTVYQLFADGQENTALASATDKILMMPDLFLYLLSGRAVAERTILSTSGLIDPVTGEPASLVFESLGLNPMLMAERVQAGTVIGTLLPELQEELGCGPMRIIAGASHDTASAVAAIPYADKSGSAFLSSGTWSLIGVETPEPVRTEEGYRLGFTNEGCFGGGNRLLKNTTGLWLLQESQRCWAETGQKHSFAELMELAASAEPSRAILDPNDPVFRAPGDMPVRIERYCRERGHAAPASKGELVRLVLDSLACSYAQTIKELERVVGRGIHTIHMVGGGIQNRLLCQLTADATGMEVVAGPVEASAIGNLLVQLMAMGELESSRAADIVAASEPIVVYRPGVNSSGKLRA